MSIHWCYKMLGERGPLRGDSRGTLGLGRRSFRILHLDFREHLPSRYSVKKGRFGRGLPGGRPRGKLRRFVHDLKQHRRGYLFHL
jgi:hypothetical protein